MNIQLTRTTLERIKTLGIIVAILILIVVVLLPLAQPSTPPLPAVTTCVPTFYDGDGPYYQLNAPFRSKLSPDDSNGQKIIINGRLWNSDCTRVITNATIDIWHADETGTYTDDWHRGQITTNERGEFYFETIHPQGYGEGTGYRPPHIHYKIRVNGQLLVTSEIFFEDTFDRPGFNNAYIVTLSEAGDTLRGDYNIVLPDYP